MSSKDKLTVEIFQDTHDVSTYSISIEPIVTGLNALKKIVGNFEILSTSNTLSLAPKGSRSVPLDEQEARQFKADLNVVISDRRLTAKTAFASIRGTSRVSPDGTPLGMRFAIVSTPYNYQVAQTAVHEIAHMLNVKSYGEKYDDGAHCIDETCLMHPYQASREDGTALEDMFCDECTGQLMDNASSMLRVKQGLHVPGYNLFPPSFREF